MPQESEPIDFSLPILVQRRKFKKFLKPLLSKVYSQMWPDFSWMLPQPQKALTFSPNSRYLTPIMPALDIYHNLVKNALIKTEWKITHDPFPLRWKKRNLSIDLGAEKLLAAERGKTKIVVEVKSFLRESRVADLQQALGQYILYHDILKETFPERKLYLALPLTAYFELFEGDKFAQILLDNKRLMLIIFDPIKEEISQWIS